MGDVGGVDGDQADGMGVIHGADDFGNRGTGLAATAPRQDCGHDQGTIAGTAGIGSRNLKLVT